MVWVYNQWKGGGVTMTRKVAQLKKSDNDISIFQILVKTFQAFHVGTTRCFIVTGLGIVGYHSAFVGNAAENFENVT